MEPFAVFRQGFVIWPKPATVPMPLALLMLLYLLLRFAVPQ
jgi:hypothetical protein